MKLLWGILALLLTANSSANPALSTFLSRDVSSFTGDWRCELMQSTGMALYDVALPLMSPELLAQVLAQLKLPIDATDRDAMQDYLCQFAGVASIQELADLMELPEPQVRALYNRFVQQLDNMFIEEPGQDSVQEMLRVWRILIYIIDFADRIGYGHQDYLSVDSAVALDFTNGMRIRHGDNWANVLAAAFARNTQQDLDLDFTLDQHSLVRAIKIAENRREFDCISGLETEFLDVVFNVIHYMQIQVASDSDITRGELCGLVADVIQVEWTLGILSLQ